MLGFLGICGNKDYLTRISRGCLFGVVMVRALVLFFVFGGGFKVGRVVRKLLVEEGRILGVFRLEVVGVGKL